MSIFLFSSEGSFYSTLERTWEKNTSSQNNLYVETDKIVSGDYTENMTMTLS